MEVMIIGSYECPDCQEAISTFKKERIAFAFFDVHASLSNLKAFTKIRDTDPIYEEVRNGDGTKLGIPLFKLNGKYTFDIEEVIAAKNA